MTSDWATAVHEAGHVVVGAVLRLPHRPATIVPNEDKGTAGHVEPVQLWEVMEHWWNLGIDRRNESVLRANIMATMAGAEAERAVLGFCNGGDEGDQHQIACMGDDLMNTFSEAWDRWHNRLQRQTGCLVRRHRAKIERVAQALMERRTLQPDEIDALVHDPI